MSTPLITPPAEETNARAYRRAHTGKLMVIERSGVRAQAAGDFFLIEDVGTHPSGLLVTGIFDNNRRGHMLAASVREASAAEIEWRSNSPAPATSVS